MFARLAGLFRGRSKPAPATPAPLQEEAPPPFLQREALLDQHQQVVAYQFTLEKPAALRNHHWHGAAERFFDDTLISQFLGGRMNPVLGKRQAFLPVSAQGLGNKDLDRLPKDKLVIVFSPPDDAKLERDQVLQDLQHLSAQGVTLACGQDLELRGLPEALALASYIVLDGVADREPDTLLDLVRHLTKTYPEAQLLARHVDSLELYQACQGMNVSLFQGSFVTHRPAKTGRSLSPYRMVVAELLNGVRRQADFDELAGIAWYDPALAYRLLRFVNSAAFGLREKVDNVKRAMTYVGRDELYRWLTLLLFSMGKETNPLDEALRENALVRARLAEQLAQGRLSNKECDEVFVVGILSVVDALFEMSMADALAQLSLPDTMSQALLRREGKYAPYLRLAIACEENNQGAITELAAECGHDAIHVNQRHIEALNWALGFSEALEDSRLGRQDA